jgi:hypothetical protein
MKARLIFHEKRLVWSPSRDAAGVVELKVWDLPRSERYPGGRKFSLYLVFQGQVVVGIDNHQPKGPICISTRRSSPYVTRMTSSS